MEYPEAEFNPVYEGLRKHYTEEEAIKRYRQRKELLAIVNKVEKGYDTQEIEPLVVLGRILIQDSEGILDLRRDVRNQLEAVIDDSPMLYMAKQCVGTEPYVTSNFDRDIKDVFSYVVTEDRDELDSKIVTASKSIEYLNHIVRRNEEEDHMSSMYY